MPAFWKERTIGTVETLTWEGDQSIDEDGDGSSGQPKAINVIGANKKRDEWEEGNYLSFGKGTASAFEKVQVSVAKLSYSSKYSNIVIDYESIYRKL